MIIEIRHTSPRNTDLFTTTTNGLAINLTGEIVRTDGLQYRTKEGVVNVDKHSSGKRITLQFNEEEQYQAWFHACQQFRYNNRAALEGSSSIITVVEIEVAPKLPSRADGILFVEDAASRCAFSFKVPSISNLRSEEDVFAIFNMADHIADTAARKSTIAANNAATLAKPIRIREQSTAGQP
jgi:hypothetical protein